MSSDEECGQKLENWKGSEQGHWSQSARVHITTPPLTSDPTSLGLTILARRL